MSIKIELDICSKLPIIKIYKQGETRVKETFIVDIINHPIKLIEDANQNFFIFPEYNAETDLCFDRLGGSHGANYDNTSSTNILLDDNGVPFLVLAKMYERSPEITTLLNTFCNLLSKNKAISLVYKKEGCVDYVWIYPFRAFRDGDQPYGMEEFKIYNDIDIEQLETIKEVYTFNKRLINIEFSGKRQQAQFKAMLRDYNITKIIKEKL